MEKWKEIKGYDGDYMISNYGRVISFKKNQPYVMKNTLGKDGYEIIGLTKNAIQKLYYIHRLIAEYFIDNPENKPYINHKNSIRNDNRIENIEWCTAQENTVHAYANEKMFGHKGQDNSGSKLTNDKVLEIRKIGRSKTLNEIAEIYGVSYSNVSMIINNVTWKHI